MKLEVGQFVRTKDGYISQYKYYDTTNIGKLLCIPLSNGTFANIEDIVKASHNIIDLIEVGDLIEHKKIGIKQIKDKHDKYIWYSKNHNPLTCDLEDAITYEAFKSEFGVGNISIVTKEQFEQMSYKVEK